MSFLTFVLKNLLRRPTRSSLTVLGIAVGISAVVALSSIARGFQHSWEKSYAARGTDMIVARVTSRDPMPTPFSESIRDELLKLPHVRLACGTLSDLVSIEDAPTILVLGWESAGFIWSHLRLASGRWPANDAEKAVVVGSVAADILRKSVGSSVHIENDDFKVCGIFDSAAIIENATIVMTLRQMQRVMEDPGKVNLINLKIDPGMSEAQVDALRAAIKARLPGFNAFTGAEVAANNTAVQAAKAMGWATSFLALAVGAVGVTNTMLMSVFERTHEIGILLAIGWKRERVLRLILGESVALSLAGGAVGIALGFLAVKLVQATPWIRGKIEGDISLPMLGLALGIAVVLGVLGGLYPAYCGSRHHPSEALRRE